MGQNSSTGWLKPRSSSCPASLHTLTQFMFCTKACGRRDASWAEIQVVFLSPSQWPWPVALAGVTRARRKECLSNWPSRGALCVIHKNAPDVLMVALILSVFYKRKVRECLQCHMLSVHLNQTTRQTDRQGLCSQDSVAEGPDQVSSTP